MYRTQNQPQHVSLADRERDTLDGGYWVYLCKTRSISGVQNKGACGNKFQVQLKVARNNGH